MDTHAIWYERGDASGIDVSPLASWARQDNVHWTVNLNDVFPDGRVRNITSGWLAASHRRDPSRLILPMVAPETTHPRQWIDDPVSFFLGDPATWVNY